MIFHCFFVNEDLVRVEIDYGDIEFDHVMRNAIADLHLTLLSTFDPNGVTVVNSLILPSFMVPLSLMLSRLILWKKRYK
jgi:hypothetical protein